MFTIRSNAGLNDTTALRLAGAKNLLRQLNGQIAFHESANSPKHEPLEILSAVDGNSGFILPSRILWPHGRLSQVGEGQA
jgi:hypothetical protein